MISTDNRKRLERNSV